MQTNNSIERTLTELDVARLKKLRGGQLPDDLAENVEFSDQVASQDIPSNVVTMYSQVEIRDLRTQAQQKLTICYPQDAEPSKGFISVLSPVGASLLGLQVGAVAHWQSPGGEEASAEVLAILFQPEASGDYTT